MIDEEFAEARPFRDVFPSQYASWTRGRGGPPIRDVPKVHVGFRLAADVVNGIIASGKGDNARVEKILREARGEI